MWFVKRLSLILMVVVGVAKATTQSHDETFHPDAVLQITAQNISQSCLPPKSVVLVNGTSPGPELRLLEGKTYWIRVYNDMPEQNLTMVLASFVKWLDSLTLRKALAWSFPSSCTFQRWHSSCISMAHPTTSLLRLRNQYSRWHGRFLFLPLACWLPICISSRSTHC